MRRQHLGLCGAASLFLVLLAGCSGNGSDSPPEPTPTRAGAGTSGATAAATPTSAPAGSTTTLQFSGSVTGAFVVSGRTCDSLGGATNTFGVSISGTVGGTQAAQSNQYTLELTAPQGNTQLGAASPGSYARLTRGNPGFGTWQAGQQTGSSQSVGSGSITVNGRSGSVNLQLAPSPTNAGAATGIISIQGNWACP